MDPSPGLRALVHAGTLPPMTLSLRSLARSRGLRALGLLAWLMLVITSLAAAPLGMASTHTHAMHAATAAVGEPMHHGSNHVPSHDCCAAHIHCCGTPAGHVCGCVGMCASALPPTPAGPVPGALMAVVHPWPLRVHAPSAPTAPPLRPPSAGLSLA